MAEQNELCVTPGCRKPRKWKGLCQSCYGQAKNLIDQGKTTWEELLEMGMVVLDEKPFLKAFFKKKANANLPMNDD